MPARIAVIGSINRDLVARVDRFPRAGETVLGRSFSTFPGGKGANQAVAAARLGARVAMVGCVGSDPFGGEMKEALARQGVDVSHVDAIREAPTGVAVITVNGGGENTIVVAPGANHRLCEAHLERARDLISGADVILAQLEIPIDAVCVLNRMAAASEATLVLNAAPAQPLPPEALAAVDVLVVNQREAEVLVSAAVDQASEGDADALIRALPLRESAAAVLTLGGRGACSMIDDGGAQRVRSHHAFQVQSVDTTAAGDAFCGGLAVAIAEASAAWRSTWDEIIGFASAAGALAAMKAGAQPSLPSRDIVEALLKRGKV